MADQLRNPSQVGEFHRSMRCRIEQLGRPGQYTSKASFTDTRIGAEPDGFAGGGDVEAFDDPAALTKRADYLSGFADSPPVGGWLTFTGAGWRCHGGLGVGCETPPVVPA